jgi:hypothetical protein
MQQAGTKRTPTLEELAFDDLHRWSRQQRTHPLTRNMRLYAAGMPNASRNLASSCVESEVPSTWN